MGRRLRWLRRNLRRRGRQALAVLYFRLIKRQQQFANGFRHVLSMLWYCPATALAVLMAAYFLHAANPPLVLNGDGFHFNCATILGGALALVLSLSIIPAQKAAEAFSTAILKLYARDPALLLVFVILAATTLVSLFLGLKLSNDGEHKGAIALQFLLMGVSLDALRYFYSRTLDLLIPQTALDLVVRECARQTRRVSWTADRLIKVQKLSGQPASQLPALRAVMFASSRLSPALSGWIAQLDEFAHKAIARRDTLAAITVVGAMVKIGCDYVEARKTSVILIPDFGNLLAGGQSDINAFMARIHESVRTVCQDAIAHKNELVVQNCLKALGDMTLHAMAIVHKQEGRNASAPLAYAPVFYLKLCTEMAVKAEMADAQLSAVSHCNKIIAAVKPEVDTDIMQSTIMDTLLVVGVAGYGDPASVTTFPAISAEFKAAAIDAQVNAYRDQPVLERALRDAELLVPAEIVTDMNGRRIMTTFPPYDMTQDFSIPHILASIANRVEAPEAGRPWVNPFSDFLKASEDICQHYRKISSANFQTSLLRKWVADTIIECCRAHMWLAHNAPEGCDRFNDTLYERLRWMVSSLTFLFKFERPFADHHAGEAADAVAFIAMVALEDEQFEVSASCAETIVAIGNNCAAASAEAFSFADIMENLEKMARAAEKLGYQPLADNYRRMIAKPASVVDAEWPRYLQAIATRQRQLDDALDEINYRSFRQYDPVAKLRVILEID